MRRWMCLGIVAAVCSASAAERAVITGRVVDSAGKPIGNASVIVYAAGVKVGYSTFCPTCYVDCGKRAFTSETGEYRIASLDPSLRFQLLVVREGYEPQFVMKVDPAAGRAPDAVLPARPPVSEAVRILRGRVVDSGGAPLRDALVRPEMVASRFEGGRYRYDASPLDGDRLAVTNAKGEFEIDYARAAAAMTLIVEARGMATRRFSDVPMGAAVNALTVTDGVVVRGRLLDRGRAVSGAEMILSHRNHMVGYDYSEIRIGTQADGSFAIPNVPAHEEWFLSGSMASLSKRGAVQPRKVVTGNDGAEADLGDLAVQPGFHVRGRVQLSDGKPIPAGMSIRLAQGCEYCGEEMAIRHPSGMTTFLREYHLNDFQSVALPPDGRFDFGGLPAGPYTVIAAVEGYEAAPPYSVLKPLDLKPEEERGWPRQAESASANLKRECAVEVRVEGDIEGLAIQLQPAGRR